ncbi:DUF456 domain-containing protein [Salisediminibacterium halotolerans]|uniref:DUF456 domain-containing protein n=1 Tax=Salisediminibacterium halotolerans TaxID=517425 RepID=UPI000EAE169C|nr:DUF456 domain-containing protein [Salisediminibacterium halotolerans]RLJ73254.1 hypothetical protein BCL39_2010 [Actinophytocola xinjiangensis]RPE86676.1 hypothetical protein EDD67_2133 [Salisediminibacterium halotolerans]TWG34051.1 hypothetical protein BCL52_2007 [Salisediminibacterium halotolerans]GEL09178.1 membrane protein [Salisediminibacterium halotolerans]
MIPVIMWLFIAACFLISFVGLVYPVIPAVLFIWLGAALHQFFLDPVSWFTWAALAGMTVVIFAADYFASMYFVDRSGGSTNSKIAAAAGLVVGSFIIPPFGVIVVPFAAVLVVELLQHRDLHVSIKTSFGTVFAFLTSAAAKGIIQFAMIAVFLIDVLLFN